jgi:hypothetical protein
VIEHASTVSGCICIFVDWDDLRRQLVQKLSAMSIPVLVLVIRPRGAPLNRRRDDPEGLHILEVGQIEAGLSQL